MGACRNPIEKEFDMKIGHVAAAFAVLTLAAAPAVAQTTETVRFTLNNTTDNTLVTLQISESGNNSWGEDILGRDMLAAGESAAVTIDDDLSDCEYDVRATFDDGTELDVRGVDMCTINGGEVDVTG